jgi:imidazoleglycerol phosphate dehydratase HisB
MKVDNHRVLIRPLLTEKITGLRESHSGEAGRRSAVKSQSSQDQHHEHSGKSQATGQVFRQAVRLEESAGDP